MKQLSDKKVQRFLFDNGRGQILVMESGFAAKPNLLVIVCNQNEWVAVDGCMTKEEVEDKYDIKLNDF